MSNINFSAFLAWAEGHFDKVTVSGDEIKVNSPWTDDAKQHLWCNCAKNAYHCWKTDRTGNLRELVMELEGCSYDDACAIVGHDNELRALEEKLDSFYKQATIEPPPSPKDAISLPPYSFPIKGGVAERYLRKRKLPSQGFYVCTAGKYRNRIIIPYYVDGNLIYWNSRSLSDRGLRYQGPENTGIGKGDVLFLPEGRFGGKVYLTEGEFDAMSLVLCGFHGVACGGKNLSDKQIILLKKSTNICLAFDGDKSGAEALDIVGTKLITNGINNITYIRPPAGYKDWNAMLIRCGEKVIQDYIGENEQHYDCWSSVLLRLRR